MSQSNTPQLQRVQKIERATPPLYERAQVTYAPKLSRDKPTRS
jgi:hypothetical protein